jgi:hypothetical protein
MTAPAFASRPEVSHVHETGWGPHPTDPEWEVTRLPLVDVDANLFARLDYDEHLEVAKREGAELLSVADCDAIQAHGFALRVSDAGRLLLIQRETPEEAAERVKEGLGLDHSLRLMGTREWCARQDAEIWRQLREGHWDGVALVSNGWKDWVEPAPPGLSANYGFYDAHAPNGRIWQTYGTAHNRGQRDYSQLARLKRRRRRMGLFDVAASLVEVAVEGVESIVEKASEATEKSMATSAPKPPPAPAPGVHELAGELPEHAPRFVRAKHFRAWASPTSRQITHVVIHTAECSESPTGAEAVAAYFASIDRPASAHFCLDSDSAVQCVRLDDVAFAAPPLNDAGVHIELAGFARQSAEEWADAYSSAEVERLARLVGSLCRRFALPIVYVDAAGLKAGAKGITTHADVSNAFHQSDHQDPGPHFPMARLLEIAAAV